MSTIPLDLTIPGADPSTRRWDLVLAAKAWER